MELEVLILASLGGARRTGNGTIGDKRAAVVGGQTSARKPQTGGLGSTSQSGQSGGRGCIVG